MRKFLAMLLLAMLTVCQLNVFPAFAEVQLQEKAKVTSVSEALKGSKEYFKEWKETEEGQEVPDCFWEILAMYSLNMNAKTGTDYEELNYSAMSAVELSKYIFTMIIDGVDPRSVEDETSGKDVVSLLKSWEAAEGYAAGGFANPETGSDYVSVYSDPFAIMALSLVGESVDDAAIDFFAPLRGTLGDYGGYTWDQVEYPGDLGTTSWVLIAGKLAGKSPEGEADSKAYMESGYETAKTYEDLNSCASYLSWKLFDKGSAAGSKPDAEFLASYFDTDRNVFTYTGVYNEHYCTKDCARAIGEYTYGSVYSRLKKAYRRIKAGKNSSSGESTAYTSSAGSAVEKAVVIPAENALTGTWIYDETGKTWSFLVDGKAFTNGWAAAVNPYAGNKAAWFCFDPSGKLLTGWQKITGMDGIARWYYLNPTSDGWLGACWLNTKTPDGYQVDADGAWVETAGKEASSGTASAASGQETGEQKTMEISISVDGSLGTSEGTHSFSGSGTISVTKGASVYQALTVFAKEQGWKIEGSSSYVKGINGLKEKSHGTLSGWTYTVNGEQPSKSAGSYKLSEGDSVEWTFVEMP